MATAKKLDFPFQAMRALTAVPPTTKKRVNPLLRESRDIFEMMGWTALPESIKLVIAIDMIGFRDELQGLFSTRDSQVLNRRKRIYFWINNFLDGNCSEETVIQTLRVSYLD
jgi:hypothetical protein